MKMFESARKRFNKELVVKFDEIEQLLRDHLQRLPKTLILPEKRPESDIGWRTGIILVRFLSRSYITLRETSEAMENNLFLLAYCGARAQVENVAMMSLLKRDLTGYFEGTVEFEQLSRTIRRLFLATRYAGHSPDDPSVQSFNVLTAINHFQKMLDGQAGQEIQMRGRPAFKDTYEWLSEFCHPNCLGLAIGYDLHDENGILSSMHSINNNPELTDADVGTITLGLLLGRFVPHWFDKLWQLLLSHNEVMPTLP